MPMNEDILHLVASEHADAPTLAVLCRVASSIRATALGPLYCTVRIRKLPALASFAVTVRQAVQLADRVLAFIELVDIARYRNSVAFDHDGGNSYVQNIFLVVSVLTNVQTIFLSVARSTYAPPLAEVINSLVTRQHLRHLSVDGAGCAFLAQLGDLESLEISSPNNIDRRVLSAWLTAHRLRLRVLRLSGAWDSYQFPGARDAQLVCPAVHTIAARGALMRISPHLVRAFPALVSLTLSFVPPEMRHLDRYWPTLRHLDITLRDAHPTPSDMLSPGHGVASLCVRNGQAHPLARLQFRKESFAAWASPHVTCLTLDWPIAQWVEQLRGYTGLQKLDARLEKSKNIQPWLDKLLSSQSGAARCTEHLAVLTIRYHNPNFILSPATFPMQRLRGHIPSLRLLRTDGSDGFARPAAVRRAWTFSLGNSPEVLDWRTASEITTQYIPHWHITREPWDDIHEV